MNTSHWRVCAGVVIAIACATCLLPSQASATSCAINWVQAPTDGATDVPTNTRLWGFGSGASLRLIGPNGPVALEPRYLPIAVGATRSTLLVTQVPTHELEPNSRYTLDQAGARRMSFVTGPGPALQPPPVPELVLNEPRAGDYDFGGYLYRQLEFSHGPIIIGDANAALGPFSSISELEFNEIVQAPRLLEPSSPVVRWATSGTRLDVGLGFCLVWPHADADPVRARFGAFDLAGNFSGWVEPPPLVLPTEAEAVLLMEQQRAEREAEHQARLLEVYGDELNDDRPALLSQCAMAPRSRDAGSFFNGAWLAFGGALALRRGRRRH